MRLFLLLWLTIAPLAAQAAWVVKSEFELQLSEKLFDDIIADFWQSLQGSQDIPVGSFTVTPGGIPIQIQNVRAQVSYAFPVPKRIDSGTREWELASDNVTAKLFVDRVSATQVIVREVDGILIRVRLNAECNNIVLRLPQGMTSVRARVRAEVAQSQVRLSMPSYQAEWRAGAWEVESMSCTGVEGFENVVRAEALKALSSFQNFDAQVRTAINDGFNKWSQDASLLLLSQRELPSNKDYLKIYYEPTSAVEVNNGLKLNGMIRFEYPYVSQDQLIESEYRLDTVRRSSNVPSDQPQLVVPFATIRALMMGEYFAGKLEYSMYSTEIAAFTDFMKNRWAQFWGFPELQRYPENTKFAFQFLPMGPPSFDQEKQGTGNTIVGQANLPLSVRMYAPVSGKYRPMVEFKTLMTGPTNLKLLSKGKIEFQINAEKTPLTATWANSYVKNYNPTTRIALETIGDKVRGSLNTEGITMDFPALSVGQSLQLTPDNWNLEGKNLRLGFTTKK